MYLKQNISKFETLTLTVFSLELPHPVPFKKPRARKGMPDGVDTESGKTSDSTKITTGKVIAEPGTGRAKRKSSKPSRYLQQVPPCENKPRSDKVYPLKQLESNLQFLD